MSLFFVSNPLWLLLITAFAAGFSYFLYSREKRIPQKKLRWVVGLCRFLLLWILGALLLEPLLNSQISQEEKSVIVLAVDASESMVVKDSSWTQELPSFVESIKSAFASSNQVEVVSIAGDVEEGLPTEWKGGTTHLSALFPYISKEYPGAHIGGVVMISDGIYNRGQNPVFASQSATYPIYTLGIGDTAAQVDAWVDNIRLNSKSYVGNEFPVRTQVRARGMTGKNLQVKVTVDGKVQVSENWTPRSQNDLKSLQLYYPATEPGLIPIEVTIEGANLSGDSNPENNSQKRYVEVIDQQKKVLLLAGSPHPDINALRSAFQKGGEFQVVLSVGSATEELSDYELVVIHDINGTQYLRYKPELRDFAGGLIIIEGEKIYPVTLEGDLFNVPSSSLFTEDGQMILVPSNGLLDFNEEGIDLMAKSPPMTLQVSKFKPSGFKTLATAQLKGVNTPYPIVMSGSVKGYPRTLIRGTNFWRTRMFEYSEEEHFVQFDSFWNTIFRFNGTFGAQDRLIVNYENQIDKGLPAVFSISVLTADLKPTLSADVSITVKGEDSDPLQYNAARNGKTFERRIANLSPGEYSFVVKAQYGDEELTQSGVFSVSDYSLETLQTTARWDVLSKMSEESYGAFAPWANRNSVMISLENSGVQTPKIKTVDRITKAVSQPFFLILLILLLTLEWGIRRWSGWY